MLRGRSNLETTEALSIVRRVRDGRGAVIDDTAEQIPPRGLRRA